MRNLPLASIILAVALLVGNSVPVSAQHESRKGYAVSFSSHASAIVSSPVKKTVKKCKNRLAVVLHEVGFRKKNHREAWAIAMRESGGRKNAISYTNDYGVFQLNKATWQDEDWWDDERLLKRKYNVKIAYRLSRGGKTWYPWGLTGKGKLSANAYRSSGWGMKRVHSHILAPYDKFYKAYRDLPRACRWKALQKNAY